MIHNFISLFGIFVLMGIAWIFSTNRRNMNWHAIIWGVILQLAFGFFIFKFPAGTKLFLYVNDLVVSIVDVSAAGAKFVFGPLAQSPGSQGSIGFILAFQALPTIVFFSALLSILYFFKIMPFFIKIFANIFSRLMRISGAEALSTSSNIFVGVESAFTIRPHLPTMTRSELCLVLTAGMATVASNVLALYVFTLKAQFPTIAGHLVSASFISAPAAIVISKILFPEDQKPETLGISIHPVYDREDNLFEAIINGANAGVKVIVGVVALLLAILSLIALLDIGFNSLGSKLNSIMNTSIDWSLKGLLGYLFYPLTLVIGVIPQDAYTISKIIGERAIATEVAAYQDLALVMSQGKLVDPRSAIIAAYALCGFAHVASMAIFVGGVSVLAPSKTKVLSQIAFRALCAATLACLMTACIAGTFFTDSSLIFGK